MTETTKMSAIDVRIVELRRSCDENAKECWQLGVEINNDSDLEELHFLQKVKAEYEAEKQAYAEQAVKTALEKVKAEYEAEKQAYAEQAVNTALEKVKAEYEAEKQAYAEQAVKTALEKVKAEGQKQILRLQRGQGNYKNGTPNHNCYSFIIEEVKELVGVVDDLLSESSRV
jgi:ATPase subunit of ABC transporter with duplicated ATPase domains